MAPIDLPHPCLGPAIRAKSKLNFFARMAEPRHGWNTAAECETHFVIVTRPLPALSLPMILFFMIL